jgi:iron complex transport system permease protein
MIKLEGNKKKIFYLLLIILPIFLAVYCIGQGRYPMTLHDVVVTLFSPLTDAQTDEKIFRTIFNMRLPRIILAMGAGAGLACAGASFQSLFANPLATPDTLGVTAGASVGAIIALLSDQNLIGVQFIALVFGVSTVLLTTFVSKVRGKSSITMLVLAGVIISSLMSSVISILKYTADPYDDLPTITYWLMGSLAGASYSSLVLGLPLIIISVIVIFILRWRLNILSLSDDEAKSSGLNVKQIRMILIAASTMITASCVSMCGQVSWVGLLVPHIARMFCGNDNRMVIPASISFGMMFMLIIDTVSRTLWASEIPISVLTSIIGAPFFIALLRKTGKEMA